jgi:hypothetical protein
MGVIIRTAGVGRSSRRTAVGPRLPDAAVAAIKDASAQEDSAVPDLPGKQRHHPRDARLPAPGHRRVLFDSVGIAWEEA